MKNPAITATAAALALAGLAAAQDTPEDPELRDVRERLDAQQQELDALRLRLDEQAPEPSALIGYDRGFFLRSADGDFGLRLGGWIQPRYEFTRNDNGEDTSSFYIRRARIDLTGHLFTDKLTFRIMPELARTASLRDGWINYAFRPDLQVRGGQFTVPFQWHRFVGPRRQHFAERGVASETMGFPNGRDIGLMLHGSGPDRKWVYGVGVFDGAGRNVQFSNSDGNMASGRFSYAILGQVPRDETDYRHSEDPNWAVGLGVQGANRNEVRQWDLGRSPTGNRRADWISFTADTHLAWQGFSAVADGYLRSVNPDDSAVGSYTGGGYMLSAGYAFMPDSLEAVARYNWLRQDLDAADTRIEEWGVGLNIYHRGHDWKTRINYLHQTGDGLDGGRGSFIVEHHIQF